MFFSWVDSNLAEYAVILLLWRQFLSALLFLFASCLPFLLILLPTWFDFETLSLDQLDLTLFQSQPAKLHLFFGPGDLATLEIEIHIDSE